GLLQQRLHLLAELRQMGVGPLAMEKAGAQLGLQRLDGARERRLRHAAAFGRAREVQLLAKREKITDLVQFHGCLPGSQETMRAADCEMPSSHRIDSARVLKRAGTPLRRPE